MPPRTLLLARAALVVLGVVVPVLTLELSFRTAGPVLPGEYSLGVEREFDPILGWKLRPDFVGGKRTAEFAVRFATNARGLREGNPPYDKPPGGTRVLVLGDSFVEAAHLSANEAMTTRLQDLLRDSASPRPADVVNAGVAAYGTAQEYLYVDAEGYKYRPDVVVLVFFTGNDPLYNVRHRNGAYDRLYFEANEGGGLQLVGFPARDPADDAPADETLTRYSTAYNFLKTGVWAKLADRGKETGEAGVDPDRDYEVYETDPQRKMRQSWAVTELLLKELAERCDELGASLVVVAAPSYRQVVPENFERLLRRENLDASDFGIDVPNRKLNELTARRGIAYLDLLPALRGASAGDPFRFYYPKNAHWNPAGHRFVAEQLSTFLIRRGLVPSERAGDRGP